MFVPAAETVALLIAADYLATRRGPVRWRAESRTTCITKQIGGHRLRYVIGSAEQKAMRLCCVQAAPAKIERDVF